MRCVLSALVLLTPIKAAGCASRDSQWRTRPGDGQRPSANPVEPVKACGRSGEEISPFRPARAFREQLAGVPVDRVAEAFLVRREVAFKHATPRAEGFDTGLDIGAHRICRRFGR